MRLGVYGGTFSPVHFGHVRAARAFIRELALDKLLIVPASVPPHKSAEGILPADERLKLSRRAFGGISFAKVSDIEVTREGKSYTFDTLSALRAEGYDDLYLLCGTDMMMTFDTWYRFEDIFSLATVALAQRYVLSADEKRKIDEKIAYYKERYGARIIELKVKPTEVSSTELRKMIARGEDASRFIPAKEYAYIKKKGLYLVK
ncbi:MAG: nicotinate (nicotinamide) nucleotide adenylyltransferase [Clostridia bacterium]|nr:nicotinate (nicotinamide) nucleotide adenylyltransferase [Clostridia bacterium]